MRVARCVALLALSGAAAAAAPLAITDVTVIDVERDRSIGPRTVLVADGRIAAIGAAQVPADAEHIDGRGRFLIPGLVDFHVHLFNNASGRAPNDWTFALYVANGVTAVREMSARANDIALVQRWRAERAIAPRIVAVGIPVRGASPEDAAHQVDAAADAGADFVKAFSEVPAENFAAILAAARRRGLPVAGHTPDAVPLLEAATAGLASNEHLMQVYAECGSARACRRTMHALARTRQLQVPTLVLDQPASALDADAHAHLLRPDERARWERILATLTDTDRALAAQRALAARRIVRAMHDAGVPIAAGTDAPMPNVYPGFALHEELALLVAAGLTPREALRAATLVPAEFLGIAAETGSIAVGKRADLVLLDADPVRDIRNTTRIAAVVLDGRLLRRAALDALLSLEAVGE